MGDTLSRVKVNGVIKKIKDDDGRTLINELNEKVDESFSHLDTLHQRCLEL